MIIRILSEGQFDVPDDAVAQLNELLVGQCVEHQPAHVPHVLGGSLLDRGEAVRGQDDLHCAGVPGVGVGPSFDEAGIRTGWSRHAELLLQAGG